jgi:hypothetical protein
LVVIPGGDLRLSLSLQLPVIVVILTEEKNPYIPLLYLVSSLTSPRHFAEG